MNDLALLGLLGIGIGGFYGVLAAGVVVGHKGSGLINLDQGALAMFPAYAFVTMREEGRVFMPWFDFIPGPIDVPFELRLANGPTGPWAALAVGLGMSVVMGLLVQTLVFGPLRNKPAISKIIGSLGALLYLTSLSLSHFGARARTVDGVLPDGAWSNPFGLGGQLPYDRIALGAIALVIGAGLSVYYRVTRTGLATRAVEEAEVGAALLGYSPNRIAVVNWLLSTTTTGLAGILALDFLSLTPTRYTLFVVPALGAALFGNLRSTWLAASGGVVLGMVQSGAAGLTLEPWWPDALPQAGVRQAVPLLVIVFFQFRRGHTLPVRSTRLEERQSSAPVPTHWKRQVVALIAVVSWILLTGSRVTEGKLLTSLIACVLMLSSLVLVGYLGQLSLANLAFAGVAAYLATKFASDGTKFGASPFAVEGPGLPDLLAAVLGVAVAVGVGLLIALPAVRIRGLQLAVVTLAAAVAATELVMGNSALMGEGARSNVTVPPPNWFGLDVGVTFGDSGLSSRARLAVMALLLLTGIIVCVVGLRTGATGRRFLAVRANERAAEAAGVDVARTKLLGFGIASGIAGVGGVLTAYQQTVLQISTWDALAGIGNLALLFLGGVGRISGAFIGAALAPGGILASTSTDGDILRNAVAGAAMIAIAVFRADGLASLGEPVTRFARALRRNARRGASH